MMRKSVLISVVLVLCLVAVSAHLASGYDERKGSMDRAEGYVKVKMYGDAINELRKVVNDNPTNAKAHLMLGDCYLATNSPSSALESYERYSILKPGSSEMSKKFFQLGDGFLAKGQYDDAKRSYDKAASSNTNYRKMAANSFFSKGRTLLFNSDTNAAERLFAYACSLDGSYVGRVSQAKTDYATTLLARAKNSRGEERKRLKEQAIRYGIVASEAEKAVPPPSWKQVGQTNIFVGRGTGSDDEAVKVAQAGKDFLRGYKITITGDRFSVWENGWKPVEKEYVLINQNCEDGKFIGAKAPKGEKIAAKIEQLVE